MKILHAADLHLGRRFEGIPIDEDQQAVLDQIVRALVQHRADVLVISGDVFDQASPPTAAVGQFSRFLSRIESETAAAVVMIAGNHDSGERIAMMSAFSNTRRALIRGIIAADEPPLILEDEHGPVIFSGLPFSYEHAARECFADEAIQTPEDILTRQVAAARHRLPVGARWVIVAHAFVTGARGSESERPLVRVGGLETVPSEVFAGAHYVALGHLHRPQSVGAAHVRYAGSPLAFGFDEAGETKSMSLVHMDGAGNVTIEEIPFEPVRGVRVLRGKHAELHQAASSSDFVRAVLTDEAPVIDAMKRLRETFPNACQLVYERNEPGAGAPAPMRPIKAADPIEVIGGFLEQVRGESIKEQELTLVGAVLLELRSGDMA